MDYRKNNTRKEINKRNDLENPIKFSLNPKFGFSRKKKPKEHREKMYDLIPNILEEEEKFIFPKDYY